MNRPNPRDVQGIDLPIDVPQVDTIFRSLVREAWIVTAAHDGRRGGLLATWVSPASIDRQRPVVLIGIAPNHFTASLIEASGAFAVHLLRKEQLGTALNFALHSGRDFDKFTSCSAEPGVAGSPILTDCLASLECRVAWQLRTGDRNYYWGDVLASASHAGGPPMTDQDLIRGVSDEQRRQLIADRDADVELQRPLLEAWRNLLPDFLQHPTAP